MNEEIQARQVRLIAQDGEQLGVLTLSEALATAQAASMDLVQVMGDGDPPVCKLMDYGKYKYKRKRRSHQSKTKAHVTHIKEIRLHPKTGQHDIDYRLKQAREFLSRGDKVLVTVLFSGRELAHINVGHDLSLRLFEQMEDVAKMELAPKREGRRMTMMLVAK